ncbi:MAG: N-acetylmuramoyl-L-alanine amidase [Lachnospiraceae bacterium]|nr:N-acetylmuramoyl-L-alanine amidase [Lachnospiraceae bacterium]
MYINEAAWYKRQQRQSRRERQVRRIVLTFVMLLCVCFGVFLGSLLTYTKNVNAQPSTSMDAPPSSAITEPMKVETEKIEGTAPEQKLNMEENADTGKEAMNGKVNSEIVEKNESVEPDSDRKFLIAIDPGHGGEDEGCSFQRVEEKAINLYLAERLQLKLEELGFDVILTRQTDTELSLEERVRAAKEARADVFISLHQNSCEDASAEGIETWYCEQNPKSERLAKLVERYTTLYTKARERGTREADTLYVIRECEMPSCLVETGFLSNQQERQLLQDEAYCEKLVRGIAEAIELFFYPKTMYLTFDDGPVKGNTEAVLDILQEKDIKTTFFVVGENVEKNPEIARRIVEEGHTIGIHCYHHGYDKIYASVDAYIEDFEKAKQVVYEATGVEVKLYRFPGGSINSYNKKVYEDIIDKMNAQGYVYYDWNASLEDATRNPNPDKLIQNAKESTLGRKKVVMLAHDIVDETVECLEELLEEFPEYEMKALEESVKPIQF